MTPATAAKRALISRLLSVCSRAHIFRRPESFIGTPGEKCRLISHIFSIAIQQEKFGIPGSTHLRLWRPRGCTSSISLLAQANTEALLALAGLIIRTTRMASPSNMKGTSGNSNDAGQITVAPNQVNASLALTSEYTYTIHVEAFNSAGSAASNSILVTIPPVPVPAFISAGVWPFSPGSNYKMLHIEGSSFSANEIVSLTITIRVVNSTNTEVVTERRGADETPQPFKAPAPAPTRRAARGC